MSLQSNGTISMGNIKTEFDGSQPYSLSEYYNADGGVPTSGKISFSDFYGKSALFDLSNPSADPTTVLDSDGDPFMDANGNFKELDLKKYMLALGWNGTSAVEWTVSPGVYVWSDDVNTPALLIDGFPNGITIKNYGYIMGKGGRGGDNSRGGTYGTTGENGGDAIVYNNTAVTLYVQNLTGGYIGGGGGGGQGGGYGAGGGGAGGGAGGKAWDTAAGNIEGGTGGIVGQEGSLSGLGGNNTEGRGGTAGGAGGGQQENKGTDSGSGGGGGGRIMPGGVTTANYPTGNGADYPGGNGGGGTTAATLGSASSGGGGTWGGPGGGVSGGSGGRAIRLNSGTASVTGNLNNVYGAVL